MIRALRNIALAVLALLAVRLAGRALRRGDEIARLLWVLTATIAAASTSNTAKARSTEDRVAALVSSAATTNQNVTAVQTTVTKAVSQAGTVSGHMNTVSDTTSGGAIVPGGTPTIQTGTQNGTGTAHTHGYGHEHYLGLTGTLNTIITQVNTIQAALTTAGLI